MEIKGWFSSSLSFSFSISLIQIFAIASSLTISIIGCAESNINTDQSALLALKAHITNDPFGIITNNWSTTTSVCNWVGIECGKKHNRVTSFNFSYMGLTATFPPELGTLSFLTYITIKNNSFHGELPIELLNLPRLKLFSIGNNEFSGEIPAWFGRLPRIERLLLYGNRFSGSIPTSIFNMTSLLTLNLQNNQLSGSENFLILEI
ncbi:probable leucine-rich repeat receptor-like protein kinase At1g68400 [Benincasa hispida]|uniref:probable leucine-rich repeat receptor-like protein kinase At1g68400 n=1 Tax=Benincasa hispida TaxID=102211 RepID=UPI0018FF5C03|nr:probable leucine-rich repeat receptor-like protein kinase At1g68400 [Benincasa hispida]